MERYWIKYQTGWAAAWKKKKSIHLLRHYIYTCVGFFLHFYFNNYQLPFVRLSTSFKSISKRNIYGLIGHPWILYQPHGIQKHFSDTWSILTLIKTALSLSLVTRRLNRNPASQLIYGCYIHIHYGRNHHLWRWESNSMFMWKNKEGCWVVWTHVHLSDLVTGTLTNTEIHVWHL